MQMNNQYEHVNISSSGNFVITVKGKINKELHELLGGLSIVYKADGDYTISCLEGEIIDKAELIGILNTLFNMRYPIISVKAKKIH